MAIVNLTESTPRERSPSATEAEPARSDRVTVAVASHDPLLHAGLSSQLAHSSLLHIVTQPAGADVVAVACDSVDTKTRGLIEVSRAQRSRVLIVVATLSERDLLVAVAAGAIGFVRRRDALTDHLCAAIISVARGSTSLPTDLLEALLPRAAPPSPGQRNAYPNGILTDREADVLRLAGHGNETAEIARILCYSERTVKSIIHDVTRRFELKNRTHAVAWAIRHGLV